MTLRHKVHVMRRRKARETTRLAARPSKPGLQLERRWLRAPIDGPLEDERGVVYLPPPSPADENETPPPSAA